MAEICFRVGDSGGSRDGGILAIKPDGWHIPPSEILAWVRDSIVPPSVAGMPGYLKRRLARRIAEIKWKLTHTPEEIEATWKLPEGDGAQHKLDAEATRDKLLDVGLDTNWGFRDLRVHGVVRVDGVSADDAREFIDADQDIDHIGFAHAKRRWRLRYWDVLSPEKVTAFRDKSLYVEVDRTSPVLKSALSDEPRSR